MLQRMRRLPDNCELNCTASYQGSQLLNVYIEAVGWSTLGTKTCVLEYWLVQSFRSSGLGLSNSSHALTPEMHVRRLFAELYA